MDEKKTFEAKVDDLSYAVQVQLKEPSDVSFEALYIKSYPFLEREARKYFKSVEDVEDVLQETYLKIFEHLSSLRSPNRFLPWAMSICARTCLNKLRYQKGHQSKEELRPMISSEEQIGLDQLTADELKKSINPDAHVNAAHVTETVQTALAELPANQEACLLLWMNGMKYREIAEELGMNDSTVKSNVSYAKNKVEKTLKRMEREGTFDYRQLSSDPVAAFLYLLEQYFGQSMAMSPAGDALLKSILSASLSSAANIASEAAGATTSVAPSKFKSTLQKAVRDPLTAILGLVITVALTIGGAVAIQTLRPQAPTTDTESTITTRAIERSTNQNNTNETPSPGTQETNDNDVTPITPAPITQNTPVTNPGSGPITAAPTNSGAATIQSPADLVRPDGTLRAYLVGNNPLSITQNDFQTAEQSLLGANSNIVARDYEVFTSPSALYDENGIIYLNLAMGNYTDHNILINKVYYTLRNSAGESIAHGTFIPEKTLLLSPREEATLQLVFPKGYYDASKLPNKIRNSNMQFNMSGTSDRVSLDYTIRDPMTSFPIKEVTGVEDHSLVYLSDRLSETPSLTLINHEENGSNIDFTIRIFNPNNKKIKLYRLEFVKLVNLSYDTLAEGRATFKTPIVIPATETKYFQLTIPKSKLTNANLENITNYPQAGFIYEFTS